MIQKVLVDAIDIRRKDIISFHYVFGDDRPYLKQYRCKVDDFFQLVDGTTLLDVDITHIDGKPYHELNDKLFNADYIVRGTLEVQRKNA